MKVVIFLSVFIILTARCSCGAHLAVKNYLDTVVKMCFPDASRLLRETSNPREIPENSSCDGPEKIPQPFNGRRIEIQEVKYNNGACPIVHRVKKMCSVLRREQKIQKKKHW